MSSFGADGHAQTAASWAEFDEEPRSIFSRFPSVTYPPSGCVNPGEEEGEIGRKEAADNRGNAREALEPGAARRAGDGTCLLALGNDSQAVRRKQSAPTADASYIP